jgi:L-Ala-D/L-Glu epimerase
MDVVRAEVIPYALPFREAYVTARGRLDRRELLLLRLADADGAVGWGETTSLSLRGGRALEAIAEELEEIGRLVVGLAGSKGWEIPWDGIGLSGFSAESRCAYATAATDLALRATGQAMSDSAAPIACNATLSAGPPGEVAQAASRWVERGFRTLKLKLGAGDDVAQVRAVREAVGPSVRLRIDANGAWSVGRAISILSELAGFDVELCEQPVATLEEMAEVRAATRVATAADESVATKRDAERAKELGACDIVTLKLAKVGGPAAAWSGGWQHPIYISSALDGPVGIAAAGHAALALQAKGQDAGIAHGLATQLLFADTIAAVGPEIRDGMLHLPAGPGLGVEIDAGALARRRL